MELVERAQQVRDRFQAGGISINDLILHIEPVLVQASLPAAEAEARKIVNELERTIYTEVEPSRTTLILDLLDQALEFVRRHAR
jgi:hypothetical protein